MKVLLYSENNNFNKNSGIGKAMEHQIEAMKKANIDYTTNIKDEYDIMHINTYNVFTYLLAVNAKKHGKKIVYHAHSTEEDFKNSFIFSNQVSGFYKKWLMKCYNLSDVILTPSNYSKELLKGYGITKDIIPISNGIELNYFKYDNDGAQNFRKHFGFLPTDKVVISVGLYIERKGIIDFVELAKKMPDYKFVWFGYSPLCFSTLNVRKAVNTKLNNLYFPGYVDSNFLKNAYFGADVFIFPTYEETEGIVLLEAMASHQNVIIRDIPIYNDLENGVNVYKAKTLDEFSEKIVGITSNNLPSLKESAYEVVSKKSLDLVSQKLKSIYSYVLNENNSFEDEQCELFEQKTNL